MPVPVRRGPLRRSIRLCSRGVTPHYPHNAAAGPRPPGRPPPRSNGRLPRPGRAPSPGAGQRDPREAAARGRVNGAATAAGARRGGAALAPSGSRWGPRPRAFREFTPHLLGCEQKWQDPRDPGGAGTLSWNLAPLPSSNPSVSVPYSLHTGTQTAVLQWDRGLYHNPLRRI